MAQSLSKLYVHIIFQIKNPKSIIQNEDKNELCAYMGSVIRENKCIPIAINGVDDHIHIVCVLSKNVALAKLIEEVKRYSTKYLKSKGPQYAEFAWQGGYAGFSVSASELEQTKMTIQNQVEIHTKMIFKDEYLDLLHMYGIEYDEKVLWVD